MLPENMNEKELLKLIEETENPEKVETYKRMLTIKQQRKGMQPWQILKMHR